MITTDKAFEERLAHYPDAVRAQMQHLRVLVRECYEELSDVSELHETLKWGESSFVTKNGSTLRMDWKEKTPTQYAMYFQCSSRLVDTFRLVFEDLFRYEGSRAVVFDINQKIPERELKECIKATLRYHKVKHLETLGIR